MFSVFVFLFVNSVPYWSHRDIDNGIELSYWVSLSPFEPTSDHFSLEISTSERFSSACLWFDVTQLPEELHHAFDWLSNQPI